uniref:histidine kinase n=1 Tax=Desulfobacca acetoxidans TaxID=60893 RepID=A0A7V4G809_9BACT
MTTRFFLPRLNIREKVIVIFAASIVVIGLIAMLAYHNLRSIELKQHVAEVANDLRDIILEMRRYEKNYLLYGSPEDLQENQRYAELGLKALAEIESEGRALQMASQLERLNQVFLAYHRLIKEMADKIQEPDQNRKVRAVSPVQEEGLRELGKELVDFSQKLVSFERQRILEIITSLKTQLLVSVVLFIISGAFLSLLVSRKIIRPLSIIEQTTLRIARGDFRPLPVLDTRDETQQVVRAFNRMVAELEKRQDQLVQSKKMSSLGILTAGIAHQLNNPLNNISTSCQIVMEELESGPPEFLKKMLSNIDQEVHRARDIVKGLLEFSRARDFSIKTVPLHEVIQRSVKLISSQLPSGVEIVEDIPTDLTLPLDPHRMQEVFLNLLMNAIQAITEPPGEIRVSARVDEATRQAVITVADTGEGIPKEHLDRIFDPFYSTKEVGVGTGLGLSIAYGIVEKHRGTIRVESTPGEGSRVIIHLPLQAEASEDTPL